MCRALFIYVHIYTHTKVMEAYACLGHGGVCLCRSQRHTPVWVMEGEYNFFILTVQRGADPEFDGGRRFLTMSSRDEMYTENVKMACRFIELAERYGYSEGGMEALNDDYSHFLK